MMMPTADKTLRRTALYVVIAVAVATAAIGTIFVVAKTTELVTAIRETQVAGVARAARDRERDDQTAETAAAAERSAQRIEDCTTPGRKCFEDAQQRLGRTVGTINRYALAAAACADESGAQTVVELRRCILALIEPQKEDSP